MEETKNVKWCVFKVPKYIFIWPNAMLGLVFFYLLCISCDLVTLDALGLLCDGTISLVLCSQKKEKEIG